MATKILAFMLSVLAVLQTMLPSMLGAKTGADAPALTSVADYVNYVQAHGAPAMDTATFKLSLIHI